MKDKEKILFDKQEETTQLPVELWVHILSFLDPQSLTQAQFVDSTFYRLSNDNYPWKVLFRTYFPEEVPNAVPFDFSWKQAFISLYLEQYGAYQPEIRRRIYFIATGNISKLHECGINLNDLKENDFILIKTAAQLGRQDILDYFYRLSETSWSIPTQNEGKGNPELMAQRIDDPVKQVNQTTYIMSPFWRAILCNQRDKILSDLPTLLNVPEPMTGKTATLLAAELGHLDLLRDLLEYPDNSAINEGYYELSAALVKSGQMRMISGFDNFIATHRENLTSSRSLAQEHSVKVVNAAQNLPCRIKLAARHGAIVLFRKLTDSLCQELAQAEQDLTAAKENRVSHLETNNTNEASGQETVAIEAYSKLRNQCISTIKAAMYSAAKNGQVNIIQYALIKRFVDIDAIVADDGSTLLSRAAQSFHPELVAFLLNQQANPQQGLKALMNAYNELDSEVDQAAISEVEEMLIRAIEEQRASIDYSLLSAVISAKQAHLLERLLVLDIGDINKSNSSGETLLEKAVSGAPDSLRDRCITLLISSGAKINHRVLKAAVKKNDMKLVTEMLNQPGVNARQLVNTTLVYSTPITCDLSVDSNMRNFLLQYADLKESIFEILRRPRPCLSYVRDVLFHNDYILGRPRLDTEEILAFAKTLNRNRIINELKIEAKLEQELIGKPLSKEVFAFEKLKIQVRATGLAKGIAYGRNHTSLPKRISFPSDLRYLNAFTKLVNNDRELMNLFKEMYAEAYREGFINGRSNSNQNESYKRKLSDDTERKGKEKKWKPDASTEQQSLQNTNPSQDQFMTTATFQLDQDESEASNNEPLAPVAVEMPAGQYATENRFSPSSNGYSLRFFPHPEAAFRATVTNSQENAIEAARIPTNQYFGENRFFPPNGGQSIPFFPYPATAQPVSPTPQVESMDYAEEDFDTNQFLN
ncbi:F-box-like domain-containing protein [Legionella micdadei]|uniref:F-box domain-containing protein n=1 Tax=Legionella micdadei TaxID=451 RepID=A0A098GG22_LEGMI|nr:F-box-like domain-containing protein [Legionella micdadei]ARG97127.1 hypothetical protein B6N58_05315 [Legionella micdadei]KTD29278.1 Ankyrin repeats (3 copies) [Legionella micdadei]NSL17349.1 hypothetical protein [Legionella micdadei]CEG61434.1 protein of unknown function (ankyrin domain) [FBOX] [Legionella micdadei]SCY40921.1 hypothetical protein SAMN02982997_01642 [Legionella micdadei]